MAIYFGSKIKRNEFLSFRDYVTCFRVHRIFFEKCSLGKSLFKVIRAEADLPKHIDTAVNWGGKYFFFTFLPIGAYF